MSTARSKPKASHKQHHKQQNDEEEIVFRGRREREMDRYQPSYRRDSRPSPMRGSADGRGRSRDGRGGGDGGERGGVALQPSTEALERYRNGYREERVGRGYGDFARGEHGYEDAGYGNTGYRAPAPGGGNIPDYVRSSQGNTYDRGNTSSSSGVALRDHFDDTREFGNTSRNDQLRGQYVPPPNYAAYVPPPPLLVGRYGDYPPSPPLPINSYRGGLSYPSYRDTRGPHHREHGRPRADNWTRPPSRDRDRDYPLPSRRPERETPRRSDRQPLAPPHPSRGPLSSARFRQGIDKHSRYAPLGPMARHGDRILHAAISISAPAPAPTSKKSKKKKKNKAPKDAPTGPRPHARALPPRVPTIPYSKLLLPSPKPTPSYIATSLIPPYRLSDPSRKLIILDLNGTLLARKCGKARSGSLTPTPRPGLYVFLRYIFARYSVMVWSSAQPENVRLMVNALFTPVQKKALLARWGRDTLGLTKAQYFAKVQVYKRLERVWEGEHRVEGGWDQTNTVLLDDSPLKAEGQPWNHVEVKEFLGMKGEMGDRTMVELVGYLEELRWQGNVSAFIREVPFRIGGGWVDGSKGLLEEFGWMDGVDVGMMEEEEEEEEIQVGDEDWSDPDMEDLEDGDRK